ncbi:AraC family transcriptional regulator [Rhizobium sp. CSW-27]|uniref:helix-turn-helix domain-containing protein n=1 Tax=Rhizobium sp. CSW-27 TaxID=2839985 RepID=UPI001C02B9C4|nr:AraC family transcriptional regulator [Rhizobium sp. CSW-27]MBT9370870.1 AraC family transcriptional regulator [Rhizobium sp. CSW-27]
MSYLHSMICHTEGIRPLQPPTWRGLDGAVGVYWEATGHAGARGYYLSPDPRIVIFFNDVSEQIRLTNEERARASHYRPMTRAIYVPAGTPMWTSFTAMHRFSHLDLHMHADKLVKMLAPSVGRSAALAALRHPVEVEASRSTDMLATLLVEELAHPARHPVHAEHLAASIVTGLLDFTGEQERPCGRLTQAQMNRLTALIASRADCRVSIPEMAACVGLSESWFASAFKQTTGKTPLQWQMSRRLEQCRHLLKASDLSIAQIAAQMGFSDQAHFTRSFRQVVGQTPAAWRRMFAEA